MLEGLFFGQGFNRVWHEFPVLNNADISNPPPKNCFCFFALNLFYHLSHSSIWHLFLLIRLLSYPLLMHWSSPFLQKIPFIPFPSYPEFTFLISLQPLHSIPPSSLLPLPSPPSFSCFDFFTFFKDSLNLSFLFLSYSVLCLWYSLGCTDSICINIWLQTFFKTFLFFSTFGAIFHVLFISSCLQISVEDLDSEDTCAVMYRTFTATNHMLLLVTEDTFPLCIRPSDELKASRSQLCFWLLLVNLILWSGWSTLSSSVLWV